MEEETPIFLPTFGGVDNNRPGSYLPKKYRRPILLKEEVLVCTDQQLEVKDIPMVVPAQD